MSFQDQENTQETNTDQLSFKVGEREYNVESATTKIEHSNQHINTIESENQGYKDRIAALEAQVAQSTKIDDALAKLQQQQTQESQPTEVTPSVSEEQIGAIATKKMEEYLAQQRVSELSERTFKETGEKLTAIYGDNTDKAMTDKAAELGITPQAIFDMAKNPATASLLLESMKAPSSVNQAAPSGSFNTASIPHGAPDSFVDHTRPLTYSSVMDALAKAGAGYQQ